MNKIAIYVRESGTRKYKPASPRAMYSTNTTFCLRYTLGGKRHWEQIDAKTYKAAQAASLKRLGDLITEECEKTSLSTLVQKTFKISKPRPKPEPKLVIKPGELMLDVAIDKYVQNVQTKSSKTSTGYRYTLQQFYASTGNLVLSQVTTQHLYTSITSSDTSGARDSGIAPSTIVWARSSRSFDTSGLRK